MGFFAISKIVRSVCKVPNKWTDNPCQGSGVYAEFCIRVSKCDRNYRSISILKSQKFGPISMLRNMKLLCVHHSIQRKQGNSTSYITILGKHENSAQYITYITYSPTYLYMEPRRVGISILYGYVKLPRLHNKIANFETHIKCTSPYNSLTVRSFKNGLSCENQFGP